MKYDKTKYGIGYKVFSRRRDGSLHAPMVEKSMTQPIGQWLTAYAAAPSDKEQADKEQAHMPAEMRHYHLSKKNQSLAYRPGWHLGDVPYATQFNYKVKGIKVNALPDSLCFCICLYPLKKDVRAAKICRQRMEWRNVAGQGWKHYPDSTNYMNGGYNHVPDGYYRFATNRAQNPLEWIITNKYLPLRVLTPEEVNAICHEHGLPPMNFRPESCKASGVCRPLRADEVNVTIRNKGKLSKTELSILKEFNYA